MSQISNYKYDNVIMFIKNIKPQNNIEEALLKTIIDRINGVNSKKHTFYEGQRFNRLTVIEEDKNTKDKKRKVFCECDCGNIVSVRVQHISEGTTTSCGCYKKELARARMEKMHLMNK